ncbi:hypothetical protein F5Y12DRAFT_759640 [Xylaria sp. FL1777]|nr:hypothetical protein F5Y12DRAFT_759640 [Xylaria sp. FL1777]
MDDAQTEVHYDNDWTPIYVVLAAIPVIFIMVTIYSTCRDRMRMKREYHNEGMK